MLVLVRCHSCIDTAMLSSSASRWSMLVLTPEPGEVLWQRAKCRENARHVLCISTVDDGPEHHEPSTRGHAQRIRGERRWLRPTSVQRNFSARLVTVRDEPR